MQQASNQARGSAFDSLQPESFISLMNQLSAIKYILNIEAYGYVFDLCRGVKYSVFVGFGCFYIENDEKEI